MQAAGWDGVGGGERGSEVEQRVSGPLPRTSWGTQSRGECGYIIPASVGMCLVESGFATSHRLHTLKSCALSPSHPLPGLQAWLHIPDLAELPTAPGRPVCLSHQPGAGSDPVSDPNIGGEPGSVWGGVVGAWAGIVETVASSRVQEAQQPSRRSTGGPERPQFSAFAARSVLVLWSHTP